MNDALKAVVKMVPPDAAVPWQCLSLLGQVVDEQSLGRLSGDLYEEMSDIGYADEVANQEAHVEQGRQVVGLSDLALDRDAGYLTATVHLLAPVTAVGVVQDAWGDAAVPREVEVWGASVRITATFQLDAGGRPVDVSVDEDEGVVVRPDPAGYLAAEDALMEVLDVLGAIPGMEHFDWPEVFDNPATRSVDLAIGTLTLELAGNAYDQWTLIAAFSGVESSITCEYLDNGFSDKEGFVFPGHYMLTSSAVDFLSNNPVWTANAMVLGTVTGPQQPWHLSSDQ